MTTSRTSTLGGLALTLLLLSTSAHALTFTVTDLGSLGGPRSTGDDINNAGQVVGTTALPDGSARAFLYSDGHWQIEELGSGEAHLYAASINDAGQILTDNHLYANGTISSIHANAYVTRAGELNLGQYTGAALFAGDVYAHPFIYTNGTMVNLGTLGDYGWGEGRDINDLGHVTGESSVSALGNSVDHAFVYRDGVMLDLGTLGGDGSSQGLGINNAGQITGESNGHAFLYQNGSMMDLGTLPDRERSVGRDINNAGTVVGFAYSDANMHAFVSSRHAFAYIDGVMWDLNDLLAPSLLPDSTEPWILTSATAINDHGQITGTGLFNGQVRAFLATPTAVPEPATWLTLGLGLIGLTWATRRRA